jgi:hypothetical protein
LRLAIEASAGHRKKADNEPEWNRLVEGGATFVATFLMVLVTPFVAVPLVRTLVWLGFEADPEPLMVTLLVATRYVVALVKSTIPAWEFDQLAANPYG